MLLLFFQGEEKKVHIKMDQHFLFSFSFFFFFIFLERYTKTTLNKRLTPAVSKHKIQNDDGDIQKKKLVISFSCRSPI